MVKTVNADLEPALGELANDSRINVVPTAEVEGGAEAVCLLEIRHLDGERHAFRCLHVVRENHCGSVWSGPEPAELRLARTARKHQAIGVKAEQPRDAPVYRPAREV